MSFNGLRISIASGFIQYRTSPISRVAILLTFTLAAIALVISVVTRLSFAVLPNVFPLVGGVVVVDVASQFAPPSKIVRAVQTVLYGVLYLAITCICGVLAAYAMQRLAFPLQDQLFARVDLAFGVQWFDVVHWVDRHPAIQRIIHLAYDSMGFQIALPLLVLGFSNQLREVRVYLLAFALALTMTTVIAALLPAASPIALVDRATFSVMQFTGAMPLDHLMHLRSAGPLQLTGALGGIVTFPSFHATVATLTPLVLRRDRRLLVGLLVLDSAMLCGTITEGAHYICDTFAGIGVAFAAYGLAVHIIKIEDRSRLHYGNQPVSGPVARQHEPSESLPDLTRL